MSFIFKWFRQQKVIFTIRLYFPELRDCSLIFIRLTELFARDFTLSQEICQNVWVHVQSKHHIHVTYFLSLSEHVWSLVKYKKESFQRLHRFWVRQNILPLALLLDHLFSSISITEKVIWPMPPAIFQLRLITAFLTAYFQTSGDYINVIKTS